MNNNFGCSSDITKINTKHKRSRRTTDASIKDAPNPATHLFTKPVTFQGDDLQTQPGASDPVNLSNPLFNRKWKINSSLSLRVCFYIHSTFLLFGANQLLEMENRCNDRLGGADSIPTVPPGCVF